MARTRSSWWREPQLLPREARASHSPEALSFLHLSERTMSSTQLPPQQCCSKPRFPAEVFAHGIPRGIETNSETRHKCFVRRSLEMNRIYLSKQRRVLAVVLAGCCFALPVDFVHTACDGTVLTFDDDGGVVLIDNDLPGLTEVGNLNGA